MVGEEVAYRPWPLPLPLDKILLTWESLSEDEKKSCEFLAMCRHKDNVADAYDRKMREAKARLDREKKGTG